MGRDKNMIGKGQIEVVGDRLRTSVSPAGRKRRYTSFTRFVNEKYETKLSAREIRRQFSDRQLHTLAIECQSALLETIKADQEAEREKAKAEQERKEKAEQRKRGGIEPYLEMPIGRWAVSVL